MTVFLSPIRLHCGSIRIAARAYEEFICIRTLEHYLPVAAERSGLAVWEVDDVMDVAKNIAIDLGGVQLVPLRQLELAASEMLGGRIRIDTRLTEFNALAA